MHEDLKRGHWIEGPSDRSFGITLAIAFLAIAALPLLRGAAPHWWAGCLAGVFALAAAFRPSVLAGLNRWWLRLGIVLGNVVSPVALGIAFYAVLVPVGILMRIVGVDPLRLKRDTRAQTYWIARKPPGPPPDSMTHQF